MGIGRIDLKNKDLGICLVNGIILKYQEDKMKKVLIVVDMQNDFIDGPLGTKEARALVSKVVDRIKKFKGIVVYTQDTHQANYLSTQEGKHLPVAHCLQGTEGWKLHKDIEAERLASKGKVFEKGTFGCLSLGQALQAQNNKEPIESIELIGLCTDICVMNNALLIKAFLPEVPIIVDASAVAGITPQSHQNALSAMKMCQINIINE